MNIITEKTEIRSTVVLPTAKRGRRSATDQATHAAALDRFYSAILDIQSRLDFRVSARGWCYLMENSGAITKAEFDRVETLINDARKSGALPLNICAVDESRSFDCLEYLDATDPAEYLEEISKMVERRLDYYTPISFWDDKSVYMEMLVEKIDLKSLFEPICREIDLPLANAKGWPDIHVRASMMRRFKEHEAAGRQCVLLYCGDHDPAGLQIASSYRAMFADIPAVGWTPENLIIDRFGISKSFIDTHRLTWIDNLITGGGKNLADPRHPDHGKPYVQKYLEQFGARKVEANALVVAPVAARSLCKDAIEKYLGSIQDALEQFQSRLKLPRDDLRQRFAADVAKRVQS